MNGPILDYTETIPEPGTSLLLHGHVIEIIQTGDDAVRTVNYQNRISRKTKGEGLAEPD